MTNKEAKNTICAFYEQILKELWMTNEARNGLGEALDRAIKALEGADYDGCEKCKYVERSVHEFPCNECVYTYENHFTEMKGGDDDHE